MKKIAFLFVGGAHQVLHTAAVAAELARYPDFHVTCLTGDRDTRTVLETVLNAFDSPTAYTRDLTLPKWLLATLRVLHIENAHKILRIFLNRKLLLGHDAIVTAERTTVSWRRFFPSQMRWIHFPHGAGDGSKGFEPRLSLFDHVFTIGPKDKLRMVSEMTLREDQVSIGGPIKISTIRLLSKHRVPHFQNGKPTVIYCPHFSPELSSWKSWGTRIMEFFSGQDEFNLIVAPHVRLFEHATEAQKQQVLALAIPGKIHVDVSSLKLVDMSYLEEADIYLGDVSSQVYEFAHRPRPCIFLNPKAVAWQHNENYRCWKMGEVIDQFDALPLALDQAKIHHRAKLEVQSEMVADALGNTPLQPVGLETIRGVTAQLARLINVN